ncbi:uncharacterized protein CLUP02_01980 [Colletotrichum lupini]|uniref:Uncharacterized protein n=1 Tax=Colletotrichum lupini TaxID=145971 RepID=A0A9Q8SE83_9PEZI|nr:uncharacterized protein CLUP02_01980 [Colletotrichum lupini]UQC75326.1 hypothetical protein CLUP02_01980 [Colletotrichum lupini]
MTNLLHLDSITIYFKKHSYLSLFKRSSFIDLRTRWSYARSAGDKPESQLVIEAGLKWILGGCFGLNLNEGSYAPIPPVLYFIMELQYPNKG